MKLRFALFALAAFCIALIASGSRGYATLVTQRDQISVTVVVNVTPAPMGFRQPAQPPDAGAGIVARMRLHGRGGGSGEFVAQVSQKPVRVEAEVSPNPTATLLYSDQPFVSISTTAGTTTTVPCAFHVTVDSTSANWILKHGLSTDFSDGNSHTFVGSYLANNTYLSTPHPAATPYVVYADDGGNWATLDSNKYVQTYCVDLTVRVPASVPGGTYSSNAVYTVYF